jgi:hypothetical protein
LIKKAKDKPAYLEVEQVPIGDLKPHPKNYRRHPADQIAHVAQSIRENGVYRNIIAARDLTILGGHGVWLAAQDVGLETLPVRRLPLDSDDPRAIKILAGDNEMSHLAEVDDRLLTELLRQVMEEDETGLLGTGFDEMMLANLVMVTRPQEEIEDFDAAAEWVGMPEYEEGVRPLQMVVRFRCEEDRQEFIAKMGLENVTTKTNQRIMSAWWPPREDDDLISLRFIG